MNETTKYGLFFLGGVVLGALGAVAVTRGKLDVKPLATDLLRRHRPQGKGAVRS